VFAFDRLRTRGRLGEVAAPTALLSALLLISATVAACETRPQRTTPPAGKTGGDLRVVLQDAPSTLNPNLGLDEASLVVGRNLFNQLIALDLEQNIIPDLAVRWDTSADGRDYTFHLRPGVKWHDGVAMTSADVKWTFEALKTGGLASETANRIARIDTPDNDTVVFQLDQPWAPFLAEVASFGTFILAKHAYGNGDDWRTSPANQKPVGTGPFVFSEWSGAGPIVLTANNTYFGRGPFVDRLLFVPTAPGEIDDLLLQGRVDYSIVRPAIASLPALEGSSELTVRTAPSDSRYYCAFNMARAPFRDARVRQAINLGIDRLRLVDRALAGYGAPAFTFYTPLVEWAHNADARVPMTDQSGARAALDAAGLRASRGVRVTSSLVVPTMSPFVELAEELRRQLQEIGVAVTIVALPPGEWTRRVFDQGDYDLALFSGSQGPDPDTMRVRLTRFGPTAYKSASFDRAVEEGARALDARARARAYFEAQDILAQDQPLAPLAEAVRISVHSRRLTGLPQLEARGLVAAHDFSLVRFKE
jgi:peptide/nickel transport system substrate-binding protein